MIKYTCIAVLAGVAGAPDGGPVLEKGCFVRGTLPVALPAATPTTTPAPTPTGGYIFQLNYDGDTGVIPEQRVSLRAGPLPTAT